MILILAIIHPFINAVVYVHILLLALHDATELWHSFSHNCPEVKEGVRVHLLTSPNAYIDSVY